MPTMSALKIKEVQATVPAADIERAKRWYSQTFGMQPRFDSDRDAQYDIGETHFYVYESPQAGTNAATAATFVVEDVDRFAEELQRAGVKLEQYDIPNTEWNNGIATMHIGNREIRGGWFRDSEGNILGFGDVKFR